MALSKEASRLYERSSAFDDGYSTSSYRVDIRMTIDHVCISSIANRPRLPMTKDVRFGRAVVRVQWLASPFFPWLHRGKYRTSLL